MSRTYTLGVDLHLTPEEFDFLSRAGGGDGSAVDARTYAAGVVMEHLRRNVAVEEGSR